MKTVLSMIILCASAMAQGASAKDCIVVDSVKLEPNSETSTMIRFVAHNKCSTRTQDFSAHIAVMDKDGYRIRVESVTVDGVDASEKVSVSSVIFVDGAHSVKFRDVTPIFWPSTSK